MYIRTSNDRWIVARKADQREFFITFENKLGTVAEVHGILFFEKLGFTNAHRRSQEDWPV